MPTMEGAQKVEMWISVYRLSAGNYHTTDTGVATILLECAEIQRNLLLS